VSEPNIMVRHSLKNLPVLAIINCSKDMKDFHFKVTDAMDRDK